MVFKSLAIGSETDKHEHKKKPKSPQQFDPDVMFMCVKQDNLLDLCELFPETKRNLLQIALGRRRKFMVYKRLNSVKYWDSRG